MPTSAPNFGFTDYAQELQNAERRRALAQSLFQQGLEPIQTQPAVGGIQTPISPLAGLSKMLQAGLGAYGMAKSEEKGREVTKSYQSDLAKALSQAGSAMKGTPSISPDPQEVQQAADQGTPTPQPSAPVAPDLQGAISAYMSHPETQQMGIQLQQKQIENEIRKKMLTDILKGSAPGTNPMAQGGGSVMAGAPGTTPGQPGGSQSILQGMDPTAIALLTSGDPELANLAKTGIEAHKGIAQRANAPVVDPLTGRVISQPVPIPTPGMQMKVGPQGNTASPIPGALQGAADYTQSQETAKAMGSFHNVTLGSGASVPVLGKDLPKYYQQTPAGNPNPRAATDPWQTIPKLQTSSGVGQTTFQKEFQAKQAENANTLGQKFGIQADMSNQRLAYNKQALELLNTSDTGAMALQKAELKKYLVSTGLVPESAFKHPPTDTIALNKDLLNAAAEKAKQRYGSRMTQSEVMLQIRQGAPNVGMTKAAIKYLLDSDNAMAQYHIQQSNDYGKYINQQGDPMRFEGWYARNFPMSTPVGVTKTRQTPSIDDLIKKYAVPNG